MFKFSKLVGRPSYLSSLMKSIAATTLAIALAAPLANADDKDINSILGTDAATGQNLAKPAKGKEEVWVKGKKSIDHLHIIGAHPLPGENCQQVIFDARPSVKSRHEAGSGKPVSFDIKRLCLLGLRNDSDDKSFVIRIGEAFETVAISPDPNLFTGMIIEPHQQIMIPVRPLPVGVLKVPLEVTWKADLDKENPTIDKTSITINAKK